MSLHELIHELRKLYRADKLPAMQVLVTERSAEEEAWLIPGVTCEIITPCGNETTAHVLYDGIRTNLLQITDVR